MNQKWYGTTILTIVILLLGMLLSIPALAQNGTEAEEATDQTIKIYVDGALLTPSSDSQETPGPLQHDGNIYLPLWALREALGKAVEWDSAANSIYIGEPAEVTEITVSTAEELIYALGSNRRILLKEGVYNLTTVKADYINANVYFNDKPDGPELFLDGIHNLTIQGAGAEFSEIIVEPRYANVLNFRNCSNISIVNIKAGHTDSGECSGGVFSFDNCSGIQIDDSDLYGCGTIGLMLYKVTDMRVTGSTIYECTAGIMIIQNSNDLLFSNCVFRDNTSTGNMVSVEHTSGLTFDGCSFQHNTNATSMFYLTGCENITVKNTEFIDNEGQEFVERGVLAVDASSQFENNMFDDPR